MDEEIEAFSTMPVVAPIQRRIVEFDAATGLPVLKIAPVFTKKQVVEVLNRAIAMPYEDPLGLEPQFAGMTVLEVMMIKRAQRAALTGDDREVESILDRLLGKPETSSKSVSVSASYEDYLKEVDRKAAPIDVTPQDPPTDIFAP